MYNFYFRFVNNWIYILPIAIATTFFSGCSEKKPDEFISLGKCIRAANYLGDSELRAAAEFRANSDLKNIEGSARDAMYLAQEIIDEAEPHGSSTNWDYVLKVAIKWKNSTYCRKASEDFAAHIDEMVHPYMQPFPESSIDQSSCQKYAAQYYWAYINPFAQKYKDQLTSALHASVSGSLHNLKDFQQEFAKEIVSGANFVVFASEINDQCKAGGSLSENMTKTKTINGILSPTSKAINVFISEHVQDTDCGEFKKIYCKADLIKKAAQLALVKSIECDQSISVASCSTSVTGLIEHEALSLEIIELQTAQEKYQNYINSPEVFNANTASNIDIIAKSCKNEAIAKGYRQKDYTEYVKSYCIPLARVEFLRPQTEMLERINSRLKSINGTQIE